MSKQGKISIDLSQLQRQAGEAGARPGRTSLYRTGYGNDSSALFLAAPQQPGGSATAVEHYPGFLSSAQEQLYHNKVLQQGGQVGQVADIKAHDQAKGKAALASMARKASASTRPQAGYGGARSRSVDPAAEAAMMHLVEATLNDWEDQLFSSGGNLLPADSSAMELDRPAKGQAKKPATKPASSLHGSTRSAAQGSFELAPGQAPLPPVAKPPAQQPQPQPARTSSLYAGAAARQQQQPAADASAAALAGHTRMEIGDLFRRAQLRAAAADSRHQHAEHAPTAGSALYGVFRSGASSASNALKQPPSALLLQQQQQPAGYGGYFNLRAAQPAMRDMQLTTTETLDLVSTDDIMAESDQSDTEHDALLGLQANNGPSPVTGHYSRCEPAFVLYSSPVLYLDGHSVATLQVVNDILAGIKLPGETLYKPVSPHSHLFKMSCAWGFTSASVALGSSYFQRLLDANAHLGSAVKASVHYAEYVGFMRLARQQGDRAALAAGEAVAPVQDSTLLSIQFTCVYLASKMVGIPPEADMLRRLLSQLYRVPIEGSQAYQVEVKCCEGLDWRLGPFFAQDDLEGYTEL